jgi:hypothetical protein
MKRTTPARRGTRGRPRVGDRVAFDIGTYREVGEITEDRGNIGVGGRRLLRIRTDVRDGMDPIWIELPEDEISVLASPAVARGAAQ